MTFGAIKTRIADELVRPDLAPQIALAISDAVSEAAKSRFWFNEVRGLTFNMAIGQEFYDATTLASIPYIGRIDAVLIVAQSQRRNLDVVDALSIDNWLEGQQTLTGEPFAYARYGNGLRFWMVPDAVYPVRINGTTRFAPLTADADENPYLTEGERYTRALAKAMLLENVVRNFDEADRQWQVAEREKRLLLAETTGRISTGTNAASL